MASYWLEKKAYKKTFKDRNSDLGNYVEHFLFFSIGGKTEYFNTETNRRTC